VRVLLDPEGRANPESRVFHDGRRGSRDASRGRARTAARGTPGAARHPVRIRSGRCSQRSRAPASVAYWSRGRSDSLASCRPASCIAAHHVCAAADRLGRPVRLPPSHRCGARPACRVFACGEDSLFDLALDGAPASAGAQARPAAGARRRRAGTTPGSAIPARSSIERRRRHPWARAGRQQPRGGSCGYPNRPAKRQGHRRAPSKHRASTSADWTPIARAQQR
jgi:hypothetical protein